MSLYTKSCTISTEMTKFTLLDRRQTGPPSQKTFLVEVGHACTLLRESLEIYPSRQFGWELITVYYFVMRFHLWLTLDVEPCIMPCSALLEFHAAFSLFVLCFAVVAVYHWQNSSFFGQLCRGYRASQTCKQQPALQQNNSQLLT